MLTKANAIAPETRCRFDATVSSFDPHGASARAKPGGSARKAKRTNATSDARARSEVFDNDIPNLKSTVVPRWPRTGPLVG
jgi:hypothetical protein